MPLPKGKRPTGFKVPNTDQRLRDIRSREYKIFLEEERLAGLPTTLYEKMCRASSRILKIQPDKRTAKILQSAIDFAHLRVTPTDVASFTILFAFIVCFPTLILMLLNTLFGLPGIPTGYAFLIFFIALPMVYYFYSFPLHLKKKYKMQIGSEIVTAVLYMAMFMRNTPNLEGAVRFAARDISGALAFELRKLVWDVELGNYLSMEEALLDYSKKWEENREFVEAVEILITSLRQTGERRIVMLDEAINIVLEGNRENAKHFNQDLRTPVMVVHAMGIILPILGMVLFPIVSIFLGVEASILFIGYDVFLPLILYFVITNILEKRPTTFSKIDVSETPDLPPRGKFNIGKKFMPAWPVGIVIAIAIMAIGALVYLIEGQEGVTSAVIMTGGVAFGIASYVGLMSKSFIGIRESTRRIENEFAEALFQLGNQISSGVPIEMSMDHSVKRIGNLKIKGLFEKALANIKTLGMTFEQAFFDREYGAIRLYPSRLVKSVMKTISESSKKGIETASLAMLSVSKYLKSIHNTQEEVKDELSETVSSLRFQAFFLSPMISGVVVTLAVIMITILKGLSTEVAGSGLSIPFLLNSISITPFQFVLVVAVYLIETCIILSMFINGIENGEDRIGLESSISYSLFIGFTVFMITLLITMMIFTPLIVAVLP